MAIPAQSEELYRLAERKINYLVSAYEARQIDGYSTHDCLAIAALQIAVENFKNAKSHEVGPDIQKLREILDEVNGTLGEK